MKIEINDIFKVNDRVYHHKYGWGTVEATFYGRVMAEFDNTKNVIRELDGDIKLLSFTEYTLEGFSQERPEELPKKGQVVWTRGEFPSEWEIGHFFEKKGNEYRTYLSPNFQGWNNRWNNKGIEIRTTNPYEDKQ
jgi:hypothetical protein